MQAKAAPSKLCLPGADEHLSQVCWEQVGLSYPPPRFFLLILVSGFASFPHPLPTLSSCSEAGRAMQPRKPHSSPPASEALAAAAAPLIDCGGE